MSWATTGLWLTSLWLILYALKYASRRPIFLLPLSQHYRPTTELVVRRLNVRLKTEALNGAHDKLSVSLSANNARISRQMLLWLYDLGSLVGVVGMLLGFALLFVTVASLSSDVLHAGRTHHASTITKRGINDAEDAVRITSDRLRINPIIPGLTVPLGHLPLILVALSISQIVHEAGHAITAALHRIPMLSCGFAVTFFLPSAFVVLPTARLDRLLPRDRLQIVSAGCFHNFLLLCLLFFAAWLGTGSLLIRIFFQDISALGRLVIGVDFDSPLAAHLPVGTVITNIDGFSLASRSLDDPWDHYLLSPSSSPMDGWCVDDTLLSRSLVTLCTPVGSHACFVSKVDDAIQYKLDPVRIFTDHLARCNVVTTCTAASSCVVPRRDQQLVRILVLRGGAGGSMEDVIVWKGPKEEIWEQVQVSKLRPRLPFVSVKLPELASAFFEYMKLSNMSLYVVNTLPIVALDGHQLLIVLLQLFYGRTSDDPRGVDVEALDSGPRPNREGRVQRVCKTVLSSLAILLVGLCGLLGAVNWAMK